MKAMMYLMKRLYVNKVKRAFSSPLSAVITSLGIIGFGFTFIMAFTMKRPAMDSSSAEIILAGIVLMIGFILYNTFLSRDTGILTMADANFFFTGPFEKRTVLAYLLVSTAPGAALTGFFMCFYLPYLLGPVLTVPKFLAVLLMISLMFGCIYLSYYYIYIVDTGKPGFKKKAKLILFVLAGILVLTFVIILLGSGMSIKAASQTFFAHWWYNLVPLFGWTKWAISSILAGNIAGGVIPAAALLVLANAALGTALYNVKADFYEKTLEDSINLQKIMDDVKATGSADASSLVKLKEKASQVKYMRGSAAIYSRQRLERKKLSTLSNMREIFIGIFYVAIGKVFSLEFTFVIAMVSFGALSMSLGDSWHKDFKKPYVFLIPASSFEKVIFSVLPGLIKTVVSGSISIIAGALVFMINPLTALAYLIIFISFAVLFIFAEVLTYRLIGPNTSIMAVTFMRMFFVIATCIPAIAVMVAIIIISGGIPDMLAIAACMLLINIISSAILAFLSRGIFEKSELMG